MKDIVLTKDGKELLRCKTLKYLKDFIEDHYSLDDCLWVSVHGKDFINYLEVVSTDTKGEEDEKN